MLVSSPLRRLMLLIFTPPAGTPFRCRVTPCCLFSDAFLLRRCRRHAQIDYAADIFTPSEIAATTLRRLFRRYHLRRAVC